MGRQQRKRVDAMMRTAPQPLGTRTIGQQREDYATLMAAVAVPVGVTTTATRLGGRPALLVEVAADKMNATDPARAPDQDRCRRRGVPVPHANPNVNAAANPHSKTERPGPDPLSAAGQ